MSKFVPGDAVTFRKNERQSAPIEWSEADRAMVYAVGIEDTTDLIMIVFDRPIGVSYVSAPKYEGRA
jgi:hypothetical protein